VIIIHVIYILYIIKHYKDKNLHLSYLLFDTISNISLGLCFGRVVCWSSLWSVYLKQKLMYCNNAEVIYKHMSVVGKFARLNQERVSNHKLTDGLVAYFGSKKCIYTLIRFTFPSLYLTTTVFVANCKCATQI